MFGREKNVSLVGLICTIILTIITIIYATFLLIEYFNHTNFSLISMEDNSNKVNAIKYIGNDTISLFRFIKNKLDKNGNQIIIEIPDITKIFKIKVHQYNYNFETGNTEYKPYIMQNCTKFFTEKDIKKFDIPNYIIKQSVCPPIDKGIKLRWTKNDFSQLYFSIYLCNKTEDLNCYSEEEIKQKYDSGYLDDITFGFIKKYNNIDNLNYSTPVIINSMMNEYFLDLNYNFKGQCVSKYVYYESDNGIIFNNIKNYTGLRIDSFDYDYKIREDVFNYKTAIVTITYAIDMNYILNYKRTYLKLTSVIVDIAGIARVIILIGGYVISFLSKNYFSFKLFNEIFAQKYFYFNSNQIKNVQIKNDINSQILTNKNKMKENKIKLNDIIDDQNKAESENNSLKILIRNDKSKKENNKKINDVTSNIINEVNISNKERNVNKIDDEKYSSILSKYLGYDIKNKTNFDKRKFTFWSFICSQFYKGNNKMGVINCCAKMVNNYLSFEQTLNNCINIYTLLSYCESQELKNIDIFNKIIDNDFRKTIKNIKEKHG